MNERSRDALTHYQVLGLEPGAGEEDIRRAFRRMRALFDAESVALYGLYRALDIEQETVRLKRAVETLLDPVARQRYDQQLFGRRQVTRATVSDEIPSRIEGRIESRLDVRPERRPGDERPSERPRPAPRRPADPLAAAGLKPEDALDGAALLRVREACGIRLEEIAEKTKISMFTLRCIESDQYDDLPAPVYLRGFLKQLATFLELPADRVTRDYLHAMDAWHQALSRRR